MTENNSNDVEFISRWLGSGGSEQANSQLFLSELCRFLDLPEPDPASLETEENEYTFERKVVFHHSDGTTSRGRMDLYRRGCFVLESKQGRDKWESPDDLPCSASSERLRSSAVKRGSRQWENAMARAKGQAEGYVRALPAEEGRPPFIIVVDVGHCFDVYAEFSRSGGAYTPFPDARGNRWYLKELKDREQREAFRKVFRAIWLDPDALDPARRAARVTREIADHLARLAVSLEREGHAPEAVASFLMRCLFSMFAEDVGLLPYSSFERILDKAVIDPETFPPNVDELWRMMNTGGFSVVLQERLLKFNGGLFANPSAVPLNKAQIAILREAARADWREVEPAIFGTLLERALDPEVRSRLGAHYTPRSYVERLVLPAVINPLREEWESVKAAASMLADDGEDDKALAAIQKFHRKLCRTKVLDPACGSGNFLYVTLEHFKRLEGEVLAEERKFPGEVQTRLEMEFFTVDPHQFLGLEVNPRAAVVAELVLWIGHLQWHFRTHGDIVPPEPVIRKFRNIRNSDALMVWERRELALDEEGNPATRWDGRSMTVDPATGREVPDESGQVQEFVYAGPGETKWPEADFIVGNPPFIGGKDKRARLGAGYFDALASVFSDLRESCDFVMYWWHKAALEVRAGRARRFGFITTNSLRQVFNRSVIAQHMAEKNPLSLLFAVPDHPWVDATDGADVRIAMTVGERGESDGALCTAAEETPAENGEVKVRLDTRRGRIHPDLTIGADVSSA